MQIAGYISTPLQARTVNGVAFHQFRLAVLSGKGEARRTTWFTVRAQLTELDADLLDKGLRVDIVGILVLHPYVNRQGQPAVEAIIDTRHVVPAPVNPNALAAPERQSLPTTTEASANILPASRPAVDSDSSAAVTAPAIGLPDTSVLLRASVPVPESRIPAPSAPAPSAPAPSAPAPRVPASVGAFEDDSLPF